MAHAVFAKVDAVGDADATFNLASMLEYWFGWRKQPDFVMLLAFRSAMLNLLTSTLCR